MFAKRLTNFLASAFVTTLMSGLLWVAQAQTSYLNVNVERDQAHFAIKGEARQMRIEIYSPGGELVFDSGEVAGQTVVWNLLDQKGQPVADGVYLATLSITTGSGEALKRIEQVTVARGAQLEQQPNVMVPAASNAPKVEGSGAPGRIPKWADVSLIGDSVIIEAANKIGIGQTVPAATLHVTGAQPATSIGNGANTTALLQLSGGKGGDTTGAGATAGAGADVSLLAGNGGDAPAGGANGRGGSITLQPGSPGAGAGAAGQAGNVLLAPFGGNVGVGAASPGSKLTVDGSIQMTGGGSGLKFPDNTIQTTAAVSGLAVVAHNATLSGDGTGGSPLGVANQGVGAAQLADGAVSGAKIAAGQVVKSLNGLTDDLTLAAGPNISITPSGNTLTIGTTGAAVGNAWSLNGNAGTNPSGNFLGTTDSQPLNFRTNGLEAMRLDASGNVGVGVTTPRARLDVAGSVLFQNLADSIGAYRFNDAAGNRLLHIDTRQCDIPSDPSTCRSLLNIGSQATLIQPFTAESDAALLISTANGFDLLRVLTKVGDRRIQIGPGQNGDAQLRVVSDSASAIQVDSFSGGRIMTVDATAQKVGIGVTAPQARLHVQGGNVLVGSPGQGIILKSPNGATCRLLGIDDAGALALTVVACP